MAPSKVCKKAALAIPVHSHLGELKPRDIMASDPNTRCPSTRGPQRPFSQISDRLSPFLENYRAGDVEDVGAHRMCSAERA